MPSQFPCLEQAKGPKILPRFGEWREARPKLVDSLNLEPEASFKPPSSPSAEQPSLSGPSKAPKTSPEASMISCITAFKTYSDEFEQFRAARAQKSAAVLPEEEGEGGVGRQKSEEEKQEHQQELCTREGESSQGQLQPEVCILRKKQVPLAEPQLRISPRGSVEFSRPLGYESSESSSTSGPASSTSGSSRSRSSEKCRERKSRLQRESRGSTVEGTELPAERPRSEKPSMSEILEAARQQQRMAIAVRMGSVQGGMQEDEGEQEEGTVQEENGSTGASNAAPTTGVRGLPKFGEWEVSPPEGGSYSVAFNRRRQLRQAVQGTTKDLLLRRHSVNAKVSKELLQHRSKDVAHASCFAPGRRGKGGGCSSRSNSGRRGGSMKPVAAADGDELGLLVERQNRSVEGGGTKKGGGKAETFNSRWGVRSRQMTCDESRRGSGRGSRPGKKVVLPRRLRIFLCLS